LLGGFLTIELEEVPLPGSDLLIVTGEATLGGTLLIPVDPAVPVGEIFELLSAGSVVSVFDRVDCDPVCLMYDAQSVMAQVIELCPPDLNCDCVVDVLDLVRIDLDWGVCPDPPQLCISDITEDGLVDVLDLIEVILAWGACQ
jgi:hypothetical protein